MHLLDNIFLLTSLSERFNKLSFQLSISPLLDIIFTMLLDYNINFSYYNHFIPIVNCLFFYINVHISPTYSTTKQRTLSPPTQIHTIFSAFESISPLFLPLDRNPLHIDASFTSQIRTAISRRKYRVVQNTPDDLQIRVFKSIQLLKIV